MDEGKTVELLSGKTTSQVAGCRFQGRNSMEQSIKPCLSQSPPAGTGYGGQGAEVAEKVG